MKDVKDVLINFIVLTANDIVRMSKEPCYNAGGIMTPEFYDDTEKDRRQLDNYIEIIAEAIGAYTGIYYVYDNTIEFTFNFDLYVRHERVSISNLNEYVNSFY